MPKKVEKVGTFWKVGNIPKHDGSDYNEKWPSITWADIGILYKETPKGKKGNYVITIFGKLMYGDNEYGGVSQIVDEEDLKAVITSSGKILVGNNFNEKIQYWYALPETPMHITGVAVRPI